MNNCQVCGERLSLGEFCLDMHICYYCGTHVFNTKCYNNNYVEIERQINNHKKEIERKQKVLQWMKDHKPKEPDGYDYIE